VLPFCETAAAAAAAVISAVDGVVARDLCGAIAMRWVMAARSADEIWLLLGAASLLSRSVWMTSILPASGTQQDSVYAW